MSLPVPLSPRIRIGISVDAISGSTRCRTEIAELTPGIITLCCRSSDSASAIEMSRQFKEEPSLFPNSNRWATALATSGWAEDRSHLHGSSILMPQKHSKLGGEMAFARENFYHLLERY